MAKNPFKKSSIVDTLTNVGIGGAANVAIDYIFDSVEALASVADYKKYLKIAAGAIGGSMVSNKYLRAAADGVAVVGVSNLIQDLMTDGGDTTTTTTTAEGSNGLPEGTIGRPMYLGQKGFKNMRGKVAGADFMDC